MAAEVAQAYRIHLNTRGPTTAEGISQNLALETIPKPIARDGQILVQMKAVALNFRDLLVATDDERYQLRTVPPLVPCVDGAGIVSSVSSSSSSRWKVGDRVLLVGNTTWKSAEPGSQGDLIIDQTLGAGDIPGMLQQYMAVDEDGIVLAPKGLSFEEVACLGAAYGTAWNALYGGQLPLKKGDVVVAQGTGGVSTAVLQIAAAAGAKVIALSSSDEKLEAARKLGAVLGLKSDDEHWDVKVREFTGGRGADHVVDVIGAASIVRSLRAVRSGGLVTAVGFLSASEQHDILPDVVFGAKTLRGLVYASIPMLEDMAAFVEKHEIKPVIARTFEWKEAREAFLALVNLKSAGKIVIKVE